MHNYDNVIVGIGEIGRPLYELMNGVYKTLPIDPMHFKENMEIDAKCEFVHICIPGELSNFEDIIVGYVDKYKPKRVFIHSTVVPGTTKKLNSRLGRDLVVHSPVHGKHQNNKMKRDMLRYPKYVGVAESLNEKEIGEIEEHFAHMGFATVIVFRNSDTTEWSKILATTVFGLQISFAQEVERICDKCGLDYDEVTHFFPIQEDVRGPVYSGFIGGHCVMPNVKVLKQIYECDLWDWMEESNENKRIRDDVQIDGRGR